jgi:hypothetical protein
MSIVNEALKKAAKDAKEFPAEKQGLSFSLNPLFYRSPLF